MVIDPNLLEDSDDISEKDNKPDNKDDNKEKGRHKAFISYLIIVGASVAAALILVTFIIMNARVPTGSMKDTINEDDKLIGFRLAYIASSPQRGDIVVFKYPDDENVKYVKRVIGLPGETISFEGGDVYVDGVMLDEPYIREEHSTRPVTQTTYTVPEDSYFMLGDNRNHSKDSRYWVNTFVTKKQILAKVLFRYWNGETRRISFSGF